MVKLRTVIFCGHRSKLGLAYIEPLLKSEFHVLKAVFLTDRSYDQTHARVLGKTRRSYTSLGLELKRMIRRFVPYKVVTLLKRGGTRTVDYKNLLRKNNVPISYEDDVNTKKFIQSIKTLKPDLFISLSFPQIFKKELIAVPKKGIINFHPSLLPKYRGPHPQFWVLANGEMESGVTAHYIDEGVDTGDIIAQIRFSINDYTYTDLYNRNIKEVPKLVQQVEEFLIDGKRRARQQDHSQSTYIRVNRQPDHKILWTKFSVRDIFNLVRTELAFCIFRNRKITFLNSELCADVRNVKNSIPSEAGTIVNITSEGMIIRAKDGFIRMHEVVFQNKRMHPLKFSKKYKIKIGEQFE